MGFSHESVKIQNTFFFQALLGSRNLLATPILDSSSSLFFTIFSFCLCLVILKIKEVAHTLTLSKTLSHSMW